MIMIILFSNYWNRNRNRSTKLGIRERQKRLLKKNNIVLVYVEILLLTMNVISKST